MKSINPGKQRKELFNAPLHKKRKWMASHLTENLLLKYDKRSVSVSKGDTVKVMRGSYKGHEDKVAKVNLKKRYLEVEGLTMIKADGKKIARPIHPSNVLITKLNLTDKWRRKKLERGLSAEVQKDIEKEAELQLKELDEQRKIEEQKAKEEAEAAKLEEEPLEPEPSEKKEVKPKETKPKEPKAEKPPEKKETKKSNEPIPQKKPAAKPKTKTPAKKKTTAKKPPAKTTAKSKEAKK